MVPIAEWTTARTAFTGSKHPPIADELSGTIFIEGSRPSVGVGQTLVMGFQRHIDHKMPFRSVGSALSIWSMQEPHSSIGDHDTGLDRGDPVLSSLTQLRKRGPGLIRGARIPFQ